MQPLARNQTATGSFEPEVVEKLVRLNKQTVLGKLFGDVSVPEERFLNSVVETIRSKIYDGSATAYTFMEKELDSESGLVVTERSNWDTVHFGFSVGKISSCLFDPHLTPKQRASLLETMHLAEKTRLISARISMTDMQPIQELERVGAVVTDVLLTFRFDTGTTPSPAETIGFDVRLASSADGETLANMAESIFRIERFHSDPKIPTAKSNELYGKWARSSLSGGADAVLVATKRGKTIGFITCKVESVADETSIGVIDLVGVQSSFQGQGVASLLVHAAEDWFRTRVASVYVGTQAANDRAVRVYEKSGFRLASSEASLHLWSNGDNYD